MHTLIVLRHIEEIDDGVLDPAGVSGIRTAFSSIGERIEDPFEVRAPKTTRTELTGKVIADILEAGLSSVENSDMNTGFWAELINREIRFSGTLIIVSHEIQVRHSINIMEGATSVSGKGSYISKVKGLGSKEIAYGSGFFLDFIHKELLPFPLPQYSL